MITIIAVTVAVLIALAIYSVMVGGVLAIGSLMEGWVLMKLWAWFVAPTFGLPILSLPLAIGITTISYLLRNPPSSYDDTESTSEKVTKLIGLLFLRPLVALLIGYIALQYVTPKPVKASYDLTPSLEYKPGHYQSATI